ncbi:MAG: abortive infection bacteriophage resistance protein, partial [Oleiphilaceae bacterium]
QTQSLNAQLEAVKVTEKAIIPLILNMIETLESSIESSLPFLLDERLTRIALLNALMIKPDTLIPEKYRRVLEAYEIEREFGYTLESYQEEIQLGESMKLVTILRVGRIGLYYQTQNGNAIGFWNAVTDQWQSLSSDYRKTIQQGISMASEQATPTLLRLPVFMSGEKQ